MNDDLTKTVRIQRSEKIGTDSRGRSVWTKPIEPTEFELVSTMMLEQILTSDDEAKKQRIRDVDQSNDGVLARDTSNDQFEIVSDEELEAALQAAGGVTRFSHPADLVQEDQADEPADEEELALVSTQLLRQMLDPNADESAADDEGGYDPYSSG